MHLEYAVDLGRFDIVMASVSMCMEIAAFLKGAGLQENGCYDQ